MKAVFRVVLIICCCIVFVPAYVSGENVTIIPESYYIGEPVTVRIVLQVTEETGDEQPYFPQQDPWVRIESVDLVRSNREIFIYLQVTPFYPGRHALPPLIFGGHTISGIELSPQLLLDERDYDFAMLRDVVLLPKTKLMILFASLVFITGIGVIALAIKGTGPLMQSIMRKFRRNRIRMHRRKTIRYLLENYSTLCPEEVYKQLSGEVKQVLKTEWGIPGNFLTTKEISGMLSSLIHLDNELQSSVMSVLARSDLVRFGGRRVTLELMKEDIRETGQATEALEKA